VGRGCCTSSDEHLRIRWAMIAKSELQEDTTDEGARKVLHDLSWIEFLGPGEILSSRVPWHSSNPNARSLSHSPSVPPPSFTQSPYPPRSLVRDGQTSPHRPRLVVSHSTCPPLSSPPHANSFVIVSQIGPAVIKHTLFRICQVHSVDCDARYTVAGPGRLHLNACVCERECVVYWYSI